MCRGLLGDPPRGEPAVAEAGVFILAADSTRRSRARPGAGWARAAADSRALQMYEHLTMNHSKRLYDLSSDR